MDNLEDRVEKLEKEMRAGFWAFIILCGFIGGFLVLG